MQCHADMVAIKEISYTHLVLTWERAVGPDPTGIEIASDVDRAKMPMPKPRCKTMHQRLYFRCKSTAVPRNAQLAPVRAVGASWEF
jgi:hypothetical protein